MTNFFNVFGILLTVALVLAILYLMANTMQFFKTLAFKVSIILRYAEDKQIPLDAFDYSLNAEKQTLRFQELEEELKLEIRRSTSIDFKYIFMAVL